MTGDKEPRERADYYGGAYDQEDAHACGRRISEYAERNAGVAAVHQIDEIVDELAMPAFACLRFEPGFAGAVEEDDGKR